MTPAQFMEWLRSEPIRPWVDLLGLLGAFILGKSLEARRWRGKAVSGFRMVSDGKLYDIRRSP